MSAAKARIFVGSLATETNVFSPLRVDRDDFERVFYAPPGRHPATPTLCSGIFVALREQAAAENWELIEGTAAWADPAGLLGTGAYESLRDEILDQLKAALPVDAVMLGLHGAMQTCDYDDCEGDLLERVRGLVGPNVPIGATYDPHSHLTKKRCANTDFFTVFKEFPHTDFVDCARDATALLAKVLRDEVRPHIATFDCRMLDIMPTTQEPMRSFVDKIRAQEAQDPQILSISVIHGFLAGDNSQMGAHVVVITDDAESKGNRLARDLGMELFGLRGSLQMKLESMDAIISLAKKHNGGAPLIVADVWDNPGGGVPGDSTLLLRALIEAGIKNVAQAPLWDPIAARICKAAGPGAVVPLRFGGKTSAHAGAPIDAQVKVLAVRDDGWQSFGTSRVPMGLCAAIEFNDVAVILTSERAQAFDPDLFSNCGVDPAARQVVVVKSTNHFRGGFIRLSDNIVYCDSGAPYPLDPRTTSYRRLNRPIWPRVENPHQDD